MMRNILLSALLLALAITVSTAPAHAQATRTWVSGVGDDANPCSRTAPCKTFAGAISKTAAAGEINVLDPGGFGAVTITKSITISSEGFEGGVLVSGTNGIVINVAQTDRVTLKGLDIEGLTTGLTGILVLSPGDVHIENVRIRQFNSSSAGFGIGVTNSTGLAKVFIKDSVIAENGASGITSTAGLQIKPGSGAHANVTVNSVSFDANTNGIFMDGSGGAGASNLVVNNSVLNGNTVNGIAVAAGAGGAFVATLSNSVVSFNANVGAAVANSASTLRIGGSTITSNVTGVSSAGGATLQSFKNNMIAGNATDGTPITAFPGPGGPLQ